MFDTVEQTVVSICEKTKSAEVNRYILGALMSFLVQSGKVINYEKALAFSLSPSRKIKQMQVEVDGKEKRVY